MAKKFFKSLFQFLCSLKLAVVVLIVISIALTAGTLLESKFDTPTAKFWVYQAWWFRAVLLLLGIEITCVALSRLPWKKKHIPFVMAHVGIVMLLVGSYLTQVYGLDGNLLVSENQTEAAVELEDYMFAYGSRDQFWTEELKWAPLGHPFDPVEIDGFNLKVDQFLAHADSVLKFEPAPIPDENQDQVLQPAIRLKVKGGPLTFSQAAWLWGGDISWQTYSLGPAKFMLKPGQIDKPWSRFSKLRQGQFGQLLMQMDNEGNLIYQVVSRSGKNNKNAVIPKDKILGHVIEPGWMGLKLEVLEWIPHARNASYFRPARIKFGAQAPPPAIRVQAGSPGQTQAHWLTMGDYTSVKTGLGGDREVVQIAFNKRKKSLPFGIFLEKFQIDHYRGTKNPASYSSLVKVVDDDAQGESILISMNEPLKYKGFTFYQSSYVPGDPRPTTSIFSVNQDPGRALKYLGSLLICLGSILLFGVKSWRLSYFNS